MSTVRSNRKPARRGRRRRSGFPSRLGWWPLGIALLITPLAVRAASVLALSGPGALRLLYPSVALLTAQALAPEQRDWLATSLLWLQFPIYGILAVWIDRWRGFLAALLVVLLWHTGMWIVAVLVS